MKAIRVPLQVLAALVRTALIPQEIGPAVGLGVS
jgi:hypothetical protein